MKSRFFLLLVWIPVFCFGACKVADSKVKNDINDKRLVKVGIQLFDHFDHKLCDTVKIVISEIYGFEVFVLKPLDLPKTAFTNIKSPRYRADSLLRYLKRVKPDTIDYIIGLTAKDISITKKDKEGNIKKPEYKYKDWGVFGLGYRPGPSCIISTFRIGSPRTKFIERFKKICVHELGHNLGLKHCTSHDSCVMRDAAETIKTIDFVQLELCENCKMEINL